MAHMQKFTRSASHGILSHDERNKSNDKQYRNIDIDDSKTHLNYSYMDNSITAEERLNKRLKEVEIYKRPNIKVLCSWVVTLPKEIKSEDERKFFDLTYRFLSDKYGKNNVVSADVHKDETTPHLHFTFVPVVPNNKKNAKLPEKVSSKEVLTQSHLKRFHTELNKYISKSLGYDAGILNGATKQNKTIKQLKQETENELEKIKSISEIKDKSGIFGKVIVSSDEYQILKNGAKEIKKLTQDFIDSKNGERLKNVLNENKELRYKYNELNNKAQKYINENQSLKDENEEKTKKIQTLTSDLNSAKSKAERMERKAKEHELEKQFLVRVIRGVWDDIAQKLPENRKIPLQQYYGLGNEGRSSRGRN